MAKADPSTRAPGRATKNDRIVVRLESEMRARLHERASALGLDDAAYVRMLIYADANGGGFRELPASDQTIDTLAELIAARTPDDPGYRDPDPLPVEEMDIPADPDGEPAAMGAGPSLLDEIAALTAPSTSAQGPQRQPAPRQRSYDPPAYDRPRPASRQRFNNRSFDQRSGWGRTAWSGPGSMTRAVGIGGELMGNAQGDGRGNVTRDNFAHLGAVGTRSR